MKTDIDILVTQYPDQSSSDRNDCWWCQLTQKASRRHEVKDANEVLARLNTAGPYDAPARPQAFKLTDWGCNHITAIYPQFVCQLQGSLEWLKERWLSSIQQQADANNPYWNT